MTALMKVIPQTVVGLALLAAIVIFGYTGHNNAGDTYALLLSFVGLVGATGLFILASNFANINALPHFILGLAIVAAVVVLGLHNVFTSAETLGVLGLLLTGTAGAAGAVVITANPAAVPTVTQAAQPVVGQAGTPLGIVTTVHPTAAEINGVA
jgi:hypothetical protein